MPITQNAGTGPVRDDDPVRPRPRTGARTGPGTVVRTDIRTGIRTDTGTGAP
ncbi:hypothetical protein GCM10017559_84670 [Streptosporangium longisporum]|uniref:Uncharacterized protein n=1 Tax=Streptosporangium longisporum TaxID=46187 RepID=A0ABP6LKV0_9ACTN